MSQVNVDIQVIASMITQLAKGIEDIDTARNSMLKQYQQLGIGWNDSKYQMLGNIVNECNNSLRNIEKVYLQGQKSLATIYSALKEYEETNLTGTSVKAGNSSSININEEEHQCLNHQLHHRNSASSNINEVNSNKCKVIGEFCGKSVGKYFNVIGDERAGHVYERFMNNSNDYEHKIFNGDEKFVEYVNPNFIEGVNVYGETTKSGLFGFKKTETTTFSSELFWDTNRSGYDSYRELASNIPEINRRIRGMPEEQRSEELNRLSEDSTLGSCVYLYFSPHRMIHSHELEGICIFTGDGRHRVLAARDNMMEARQNALERGDYFNEEDYYIPTTIVGRYTHR